MSRNHDKNAVLPAMKGMYASALQSLCGWDGKLFNKRKHQPCPLCGGSDRFRWTDKLEHEGDGGAVCNGCGSDTGLGWIMKSRGESFTEAIDTLGDWLNMIPQEVILKANKRAKLSGGFSFGGKADPDKVSAAFDRCSERTESQLMRLEGIPYERVTLGTKTSQDGAQLEWLTLPMYIVADDGAFTEDMVNFSMIDIDGMVSFYAKEITFGSVSVIPGDGKAIYITPDWADAYHAATATRSETWISYSASNLEIVASQYKGEKPLRVICREGDRETLIQAENANLPVLLFNGDNPKMGVRRELFNASDLIK